MAISLRKTHHLGDEATIVKRPGLRSTTQHLLFTSIFSSRALRRRTRFVFADVFH
ncbi:hypothetical protein HanPSC8_Chr17g0776291 [Helianthus annuus]|nr:hypothetical protein HanPSC8_Chr17g0776291 [Helianthus annuus]